mmetsp:Transcript_47524/g.111848  ORF Transcript_47524/g.111848 Transcript_47524/m.111848 type:complete len:438 (-) Transcript_47524:559-1872(-)
MDAKKGGRKAIRDQKLNAAKARDSPALSRKRKLDASRRVWEDISGGLEPFPLRAVNEVDDTDPLDLIGADGYPHGRIKYIADYVFAPPLTAALLDASSCDERCPCPQHSVFTRKYTVLNMTNDKIVSDVLVHELRRPGRSKPVQAAEADEEEEEDDEETGMFDPGDKVLFAQPTPGGKTFKWVPGQIVDSDFWNGSIYDDHARLQVPEEALPSNCNHTYLVECTSRCTIPSGVVSDHDPTKPRCPRSCRRTSQAGITAPIEVFRLEYGCWGVRASEDIEAGVFICSYLGQVLNAESAGRASHLHHEVGMDYLMDLNPNSSLHASVLTGVESYMVVDGMRFRNVAPYINHSCSPNLRKVRVYAGVPKGDLICSESCPVEHAPGAGVDPRMYRLALFTAKPIKQGEELTWDYGYSDLQFVEGLELFCFCGSDNCVGRLL